MKKLLRKTRVEMKVYKLTDRDGQTRSPRVFRNPRPRDFRPSFHLVVEYAGGINLELDKELQKIVAKPRNGSGQLLCCPYIRDLSWWFRDEQCARTAFRRVFTKFKRRITLPVRLGKRGKLRTVLPAFQPAGSPRKRSPTKLHPTLRSVRLTRTGSLTLAKADFESRKGQRTLVRTRDYSWR